MIKKIYGEDLVEMTNTINELIDVAKKHQKWIWAILSLIDKSAVLEDNSKLETGKPSVKEDKINEILEEFQILFEPDLYFGVDTSIVRSWLKKKLNKIL
jgi:hypothetical protein